MICYCCQKSSTESNLLELTAVGDISEYTGRVGLNQHSHTQLKVLVHYTFPATLFHFSPYIVVAGGYSMSFFALSQIMTLCLLNQGKGNIQVRYLVVLSTRVWMFSKISKHCSHKVLLHIECFELLNLNSTVI